MRFRKITVIGEINDQGPHLDAMRCVARNFGQEDTAKLSCGSDILTQLLDDLVTEEAPEYVVSKMIVDEFNVQLAQVLKAAVGTIRS